MEPFIIMLVENIDRRFLSTSALQSFDVFKPSKVLANPAPNFGVKEMQALAKQIPRLEESVLLQEWDTFTERVKIPDLRVSDDVQYI